MASINQNAYSSALPNFRNMGILLRVLLIVNAVAVAEAVLRSSSFTDFPGRLIEVSIVVQPLLIASLLALTVLNDFLRRLPYWLGVAVVIALELGLTSLICELGSRSFAFQPGPTGRYWLVVALTSAMLLAYLDLRGRALSPAVAEARLQALQARIRPHFLYNSLNAVLALIRQNPKRAETALEDLASLFRVLMAENRELAPLVNEVELCRQYLDLEQLRLGDRLKVEWRIDNMPTDALMPPLLLQPLLENAVYHGIEPRTAAGVISIDIYAAREQVHCILRNPFDPAGAHHPGNNMALANIRERLTLHFDAEASLTVKAGKDSYQVHIVIPYLKAPSRG
jgi:two-component system sensor histidine kinase AlgZ